MDPTQQFPCVQLCLPQRAHELIDCKPLEEKGFRNELCILTERKTLHGESIFIEQPKTSHLFQNTNPRTISAVVKPLESRLSRRKNCWCVTSGVTSRSNMEQSVLHANIFLGNHHRNQRIQYFLSTTGNYFRFSTKTKMRQKKEVFKETLNIMQMLFQT